MTGGEWKQSVETRARIVPAIPQQRQPETLTWTDTGELEAARIIRSHRDPDDDGPPVVAMFVAGLIATLMLSAVVWAGLTLWLG